MTNYLTEAARLRGLEYFRNRRALSKAAQQRLEDQQNAVRQSRQAASQRIDRIVARLDAISDEVIDALAQFAESLPEPSSLAEWTSQKLALQVRYNQLANAYEAELNSLGAEPDWSEADSRLKDLLGRYPTHPRYWNK